MGYAVSQAVESIKELITYIENNNASKCEKEETRRLKEILSLLDTRDVIFIEWGVEDIEARVEGTKITRAQAQDILEELDRRHDCNYGITWDTIDFHLGELLEVAN